MAQRQPQPFLNRTGNRFTNDWDGDGSLEAYEVCAGAPTGLTESEWSVSACDSLGNERVEIPDLYGESLQSALRGLEQIGLPAGARIEVNGHAGPDQVIATGPPVASEGAPGTDVDLLVNSSPRDDLWVMPSLVSRNIGLIRRFCAAHGLRLGQIHEVAYPGLSAGLVLRQYPPAGSPLSRSDIISVWVSQ